MDLLLLVLVLFAWAGAHAYLVKADLAELPAWVFAAMLPVSQES